jgi:hypothetical protein
LRKHPKLLKNSPVKARELLLRRYSNNPAQLRGIMAEAMFLDHNPEWGYVQKPNASQHDVYRWVLGRRTPMTGQIKYHANGNPVTYAADMVKDYRSERFFIPDDHVEPTRTYLQRQADKLSAAGDKQGAAQAYRNRNRVQPMGVQSSDIASSTNEAAKAYAREKYATYVSLGASLALALGPNMYDWASGDIAANQALYRTTRALSLLGVGVGTDLALMAVKEGALRGTIRGNVIVGTALTITEVTWLLYEHGWQRAFYQPQFYEQVVGGVSGIALGFAGGMAATVLTAEMGPWVAIPAGFVTGVVAGTVGYVGGRSGTYMVLDAVFPEMIQQQERQQLESVKSSISKGITALQSWPPK